MPAASHYPITLRELAYREAESSYDIAMHTHNCYQFYGVIGGQVEMRFQKQVVPLQPGQCIIVPPEHERGPRCTGKAPRYVIAMFDVHNFAIERMCSQVLPLTEAMSQQMDHLIADLNEPDLGNAADYRIAVFLQVLIDLRRRMRAGRRTNQLPRLNAAARNEVVTQAENYMRANLHLSLSREQIAAAVHFSAPHLARLFKASLDRTINQRLTELRLDHAKRLLLQSTYPITKIAGEVGFQSFSHFAKLFQKAVGMTPSDYRGGGGRRLVAR